MAKKNRRRTFKGEPITDELLELYADEAERGYDLSTLKRRPGRPSIGSGPAAHPSAPARPTSCRCGSIQSCGLS